MNKSADCGWLYLLGDGLFGEVLLLGTGESQSAVNEYSRCVDYYQPLNIPLDKKYDCMLIEIDSIKYIARNKTIINERFININEGGNLAILVNNELNIKLIFRPFQYLNGVLSTAIFNLKLHVLNNNSKTDIWRCYHLVGYDSGINAVVIDNAYIAGKNNFSIKDKIKSCLLTYGFSWMIAKKKLYVLNEIDQSSLPVIEKLIKLIEDKLHCKNISIENYAILPYKAIVSLVDGEDSRYILLLLSGSTGNIRANKEREMIAYINENYPKLSGYVSEMLFHGFHKSSEYYIYKKLPGISIDVDFNRYSEAFDHAYDMVVNFAEITQKNTIFSKQYYSELITPMIDELSDCDKSDGKLSSFLKIVEEYIKRRLIGVPVNLVLFHGDYKIENILFDRSDYTINGIIDWDLSEKSGLPLMDLLYLIVYSRYIKSGEDFDNAVISIATMNDISPDERLKLSDYREKFAIDRNQYLVIILVFIMHHYTRRRRCRFNDDRLIKLLNTICAQN